MFCCGYDPGLEAYLAYQGTDVVTPPAPGPLWAATGLLAITIVSLITIGLL